MVRGPWGADNQMGIKRKMNDMTKKPEGLKAFDDLCRKLVKVAPAKSPTRWAIWRLYPDNPGCVDYLGSVDAASRDEAETIGRREFGCDPGDEIDVQPDNEKP